MSPFEAGRKLLSMESARLSLGDRLDLVFQDADLVPLLIQAGPWLLGYARISDQALSLGDRLDLVFQDANLVPLLIQAGPYLLWFLFELVLQDADLMSLLIQAGP